LKEHSKPGVLLSLERERAYQAKQKIVNSILLKNLTGMLLLLISAAYIATTLAVNSR